MAHGAFIWCDLSAYKPGRSTGFYGKLFGWSFTNANNQRIALNGTVPTAAIYQMPVKFMQMEMPSFWMSYIAVDDVEATVAQATALGGKVELGPEAFPGGGRYALIRDPLGAGFTVLEGEDGTEPSRAPGARAGHALFVSDASKIIPFYQALFGWSFGEGEQGVRPVYLGQKRLFHCHEIADDAVRGKEQYWAVLFSASAPEEIISKQGGGVVARFNLPEGPAVLARDPDGAAFILLKREGTEQTQTQSADLPWRAWLGLALVLISSLTSHLWPWAIFLGLWVVQALRDEQTYLLQPISKRGQPVLFWLILAVFSVLAAVSLLYPFGTP